MGREGNDFTVLRRGLTAGAFCEAASLAMVTWPRRLMQAACGEAGSVTVAGDVAADG